MGDIASMRDASAAPAPEQRWTPEHELSSTERFDGVERPSNVTLGDTSPERGPRMALAQAMMP
jgi:hypothetical protein